MLHLFESFSPQVSMAITSRASKVMWPNPSMPHGTLHTAQVGAYQLVYSSKDWLQILTGLPHLQGRKCDDCQHVKQHLSLPDQKLSKIISIMSFVRQEVRLKAWCGTVRAPTKSVLVTGAVGEASAAGS